MLKLFLLSLAVFALGSPAAQLAPGKCDVSNAKVPTGSLPAQTSPTKHIAFGMGTQNYTCSAAGTYASAGAVASLFDVSCFYPKTAGAAPTINASSGPMGQHYFITNPVNASAGASPKWDFASSYGDPNAFVVAAKVAGVPATAMPTFNVDWLKLSGMSGQGGFASEIYRTHTFGGQPPSSCTAGSGPITVPYLAVYWFTGGSF
ncbi:hypothetical protein AAF712_011305 [Marasmius tenuissimus]|uniref:Malate dehydrogenase n=1 Tax=Marasmius tenuissimus TaxID=585030 RepID=A0ABR2ZMB9_9AGAR|nr:hypothetical protein PM082_007418 [Marasmius tenuissimus]